jgi:septum formation protein
VARSLSERLPRLVLASQSPRRRQLLNESGLAHEAVHPGVDDGILATGDVPAGQWVAALAYFKAAAGADAVDAEARAAREGGLLVLGADTVCVHGSELLGQPRDAEDAAQMLRKMEDASHDVVTGVALLWVSTAGDRRRELLVDRARVRVGPLGPARIDEYVATGEWSGKAGAYNLSERMAAGWPIEYDGDPTTIMGLPMRALLARLEQAAAERESDTTVRVVPGPGPSRLEQSSDA